MPVIIILVRNFVKRSVAPLSTIVNFPVNGRRFTRSVARFSLPERLALGRQVIRIFELDPIRERPEYPIPGASRAQQRQPRPLGLQR